MTMRKMLLLGLVVIGGLIGILSAQTRAFSDTPKPGAVPADVDVTDFSDWRFACAPADKKAPKDCRIFQRVSWGKDKARQLSLSVTMFNVNGAAAPAGKAKEKPVVLMRIVMPLGVDLRAGLGMLIGKGGKQVNIPYSVCVPGGCVATIGLVSEIVDKIKAANGVTIAFKSPGPGKPVGLNISTKGFAQAVDALIKAKR